MMHCQFGGEAVSTPPSATAAAPQPAAATGPTAGYQTRPVVGPSKRNGACLMRSDGECVQSSRALSLMRRATRRLARSSSRSPGHTNISRKARRRAMRKALSRRRELSFTLVSIVYSSRGFSTNKASGSAEASTRSEAAQSIDPKTGSGASAAPSAESASFTKFTSQASRPQRQSVLAHLRQRRTTGELLNRSAVRERLTSTPPTPQPSKASRSGSDARQSLYIAESRAPL